MVAAEVGSARQASLASLFRFVHAKTGLLLDQLAGRRRIRELEVSGISHYRITC